MMIWYESYSPAEKQTAASRLVSTDFALPAKKDNGTLLKNEKVGVVFYTSI